MTECMNSIEGAGEGINGEVVIKVIKIAWDILYAIDKNSIKKKASWVWWCMPLIPALGRQRQEDLCEFKANLVHRMSSKPGGAIERPCLKKKEKGKSQRP